MTNAGALSTVLLITAVLFTMIVISAVVGIRGVGLYASLEAVKYRICLLGLGRTGWFCNQLSLRATSSELGVKGILFWAVTGMICLSDYFLNVSSFQVKDGFLNAFVFAVTYLTDAAILIVSQILVATAFAESAVLGRQSFIREALITSVTFNVGLALLRVSPIMHGDYKSGLFYGNDYNSKPWKMLLLTFLFVGTFTIFLLYKYGSRFIHQFKNCMREEEVRDSTTTHMWSEWLAKFHILLYVS